eukprot:maker-scaffold836_size90567-snap-gene-0.16 protein:Tk11225 transcript:maker-scaffold836_size90567-snap-gene-0.16-mRNA-1 annotation:"---NA---"
MRFLHGSTVWLRRVPLPALAGSWSVWGWSEGSSFDESQRYVDLQPQYEARDELDWRSRLELMWRWLSGETVGERWQREYEERKLAQKVSQMSTNSALDNMLEDHSPSINEVSSSRPRSGPAGPAPMPSELDELEADSLEVDKTYIERTLSKMKHFFMG